MRRIALAVLGICVLGFSSLLTANDAKAGEYYGYSGNNGGNVWYSSSCCYRKVVKHVRKVNYVRSDDGYRDGYYAPRYRSSYYDGDSYRTSSYGYRTPYYNDRSYRYSGGEYYGGNNGYYGGNGGGNGYRVSYGDSYAQGCTVRRIRVADGYGGWTWASSRVCY